MVLLRLISCKRSLKSSCTGGRNCWAWTTAASEQASCDVQGLQIPVTTIPVWVVFVSPHPCPSQYPLCPTTLTPQSFPTPQFKPRWRLFESCHMTRKAVTEPAHLSTSPKLSGGEIISCSGKTVTAPSCNCCSCSVLSCFERVRAVCKTHGVTEHRLPPCGRAIWQ